MSCSAECSPTIPRQSPIDIRWLCRSASDRAAESKEKHTPQEAKGPSKGHPKETNGRARSSGDTKDVLKAASAPKDALKELRARGGVKTLR